MVLASSTLLRKSVPLAAFIQKFLTFAPATDSTTPAFPAKTIPRPTRQYQPSQRFQIAL
jgi:hypothetical protein